MNSVAIVGGGPAGLMCAIIAKRSKPDLDITIFEKKDIGHTILPTGGGRCNLSHNSSDIREFVQNYPRGEKFLYGVFNQFFIDDTIKFFDEIGVKTYIQDDNRIFPCSNKSLDVIFALKNEVKRLNINIKKIEIIGFEYNNNKFVLNNKEFDKLVISTGGKKTKVLESLTKLGHNIIEQKPALCGLEIKEKEFAQISGVSLKNISATVKTKKQEIIQGDLLFTHKGISGPLAYKISSLFLNSQDKPLKITLNFVNDDTFNLQDLLNKNSKKKVVSLISEFMPKSLAVLLLDKNNLTDKFCHEIVKDERKILENILKESEINIVAPLKDMVIVSSGGVDLKEITPKTMESKVIKNLFFCGEVVDIDGFCGGFNLQNCWSTGYVAGINL